MDSVTREYIANRGCSESVDVIAGDIFSESLAEGYDVHLWSNVLHDWDASTVKQLLGKSFRALPSGGMVAIHDSHINRKKTGPLPVANYSVFPDDFYGREVLLHCGNGSVPCRSWIQEYSLPRYRPGPYHHHGI